MEAVRDEVIEFSGSHDVFAGDKVVYLTDAELATGNCDDLSDAAGTTWDAAIAEGRGGVVTQGSINTEVAVNIPPGLRSTRPTPTRSASGS